MAAIGITNLADAAVSVLGFNDYPEALAINMIDPHVGNKWRCFGNLVGSTIGYFDLGASYSVDTLALMGVSSSEGPDRAFFHLQTATVSDFSVMTLEAYNIANVLPSPYFDPDYGTFVYLLSSPVMMRYVRFYINVINPAAIYLEAGRAFVGLRDTFDVNMQMPWGRSGVRSSISRIGVGGQSFIERRRGHFQQSVKFDFVTESDRAGFLETLGVATLNGHRDVLWIPDTASENLSRDCLWGYIDGDLTITQDKYVDEFPYSCEFKIRQRL